MKFSRAKLVIMGTVKKYLFFDKAFKYDFKRDPLTTKRVKSSKRVNPEECVRKSRKRLRESICANAWQHDDPKTRKPYTPQFITYTFGAEVKSLKIAHPIFRNFIKRFNNFLKYKLLYNSVPEFQPVSGRVHYHVLFYNLEFIESDNINKLYSDIWGQGFVFGKSFQSLDHIINYVSKYIQKDFSDKSEKSQKRFLSSQGLKKPICIKEEKAVMEDLEKTFYQPNITSTESRYVAPDGRKVHELKVQYPRGHVVD